MTVRRIALPRAHGAVLLKRSRPLVNPGYPACERLRAEGPRPKTRTGVESAAFAIDKPVGLRVY